MTRFQYTQLNRCKLFTDEPAIADIAIQHARRFTTRTLYGKTLSWLVTMDAIEAQAVQADLLRRGIEHTCRSYDAKKKRDNFFKAVAARCRARTS